MKKFSLTVFVLLSAASFLHAGEPQILQTSVAAPPIATAPIDFFSAQSSYVFESDVVRGGVNVGSQDAFSNSFEYGHRFLISGNFYFHAGLAYQRFDFGSTDSPLPVHLQSGAAVIGIDYLKGSDVAAFLEFRPGFYTENKLGINSFDCPITLARFWTISPDRIYFLTGINVSFLRGQYPVLPLVGLVWNVTPQWKILAVPPEPKIVYSPNKSLSIWGGGELTGGSYRTDPELQGPGDRKLNNAQVDYFEYRAGVGLTFAPSNHLNIDFSAGYAIQREFDYERANHIYRSDPAPYVKVAALLHF